MNRRRRQRRRWPLTGMIVTVLMCGCRPLTPEATSTLTAFAGDLARAAWAAFLF